MSSMPDSHPPSNAFRFVLIPASDDAPIQEQLADPSGGLTDDALIKHAKDYFHNLTGAQARLDTIQRAQASDNPNDKRALANQIRQQMKAAGLDEDKDDNALLETLIQNSLPGSSCDITALTIPTQANIYKAVSMYMAHHAKESGLPPNPRATALYTACGHRVDHNGIYGDVFVGRAHDNEASDEWRRDDFVVNDAQPTAEWCRVARSPQGGGGHGGQAAAASLSGLLQQQQQQQGRPLQVVDGSAGDATSNPLYGADGAPPVQESWGTWTQTDDEVELVLSVPLGVKAKDCQVQFRHQHLAVTVWGETRLEKSSLFLPIDVEESTFTLQDQNKDISGGGGRDLTITLAKAEMGKLWSFAVEPAPVNRQ